MKQLYLSVLLLLMSFFSSAQHSGYIVVDGEKKIHNVRVKKEKSDYLVYFQMGASNNWNVLYPDNADAACIFAKKYFVSVQLPESGKRVWMNCFINGKDLLLFYRGSFYLKHNDELIALANSQQPGDQKGKKQYVDQLSAIYGGKIVFDFASLKYEAESLSEPLIKYHRQQRLKYEDYNTSQGTVLTPQLSVGLRMSELDITGVGNDEPKSSGTEPFVEAGVTFSSPGLPKWLSFYGGLGLGFSHRSTTAIHAENSNLTNYYTLTSNGISASVPLLIDLNLIKRSVIGIQLQSGLSFEFYQLFNPIIRKEIESQSTVTTRLYHPDSNRLLTLAHESRLLLSLPQLNSRIRAGGAYGYSLGNPGSSIGLHSRNSIRFFLRYSF